MTDIITTLHPENDENVNLYPNVKKANIPNKSIDRNKLDDSVNSLLNSINELHPSGVDTSTNILAFTNNKGIYIGSDTGHWYYWNGTQYVDGGIYQATALADGSITPSKLDRIYVEGKIGKNNFDKTDSIVNGYYLKPNDGGISPNVNYFYQNKYIKIKPNTSYAFSKFTNISTGVFIIFYDSTKTFISGISRTSSAIITTPNSAEYCRISATLSIIDDIQLEEGNQITPYENYEQINKDASIDFNMLKEPIKTFNQSFINKINMKYATHPLESILTYNSGYLLKSDGTIEGGYNVNEWKVSDYINAEYGAHVECIAFTTNAGVCTYDENYNFIKSYTNTTSSAAIRNIIADIRYGECKYIRIQWQINNNPNASIFNDISVDLNNFIGANTNLIIVNKNGYGDYTEIQDALDNVNDSVNNPITILVMAGTYQHFHTWKTKQTRSATRYVSIIGISRDTVIVEDTLNSTFESQGTLANMTLISNDTLPEGYDESEYDSLWGYALHIDYNTNTDKTIENCKIISYKGASLGMGLHADETITIKNCEILRKASDHYVQHGGPQFSALLVHNGGTTNENQLLNIHNCIIKSDYNYSMYLYCAYNEGKMTIDSIFNLTYSIDNNFNSIWRSSGSKLSGDYIELSLSSYGNSATILNN